MGSYQRYNETKYLNILYGVAPFVCTCWHHLLNNSNIVTGPQNVSLCDQQSHTFPTDWCTNLDLHFVGLYPDLNIISSMPGY